MPRKRPPTVTFTVSPELLQLAEEIDQTPSLIVQGFVNDCLKAVRDNQACLPHQAREHLVPVSVNVIRALLHKPTTLLFASQPSSDFPPQPNNQL